MKRILIGTVALGLSVTFVHAQDVVRMGTEGAYPPFNFINDDGDVDGFDIDVGNELCARAELTCEWVTNDWDSIIPNLVSGNYDTIMAGMSITDERDSVIDFTQNYLRPEPSAYLALSDEVDLEGGVIAAQTGTIQAGHVAETGAVLVEFPTPDDTVAAVRNGEVDAVLADKSFLRPIADQGGDLRIVGEDVFLGNGIGVGVRESDPELRDTLDAAIQSMKDDGSLNALIEKWLPAAEPF